MAGKVDNAEKAAIEAKDTVKEVEAKMVAFQVDLNNMKQSFKEMEEKVTAKKSKDTMEETEGGKRSRRVENGGR